MILRRLFARGLLRQQVVRITVASILPLVVVVVTASTLSNELLRRSFEDQARLLSQSAASALDAKVQLLTRSANLIAGLPTTRDRASTIKIDDAHDFPDDQAVENAQGDALAHDVRIEAQNYYGIFSLVRAHAPESFVLAVLVPLTLLQGAQERFLLVVVIVVAILLPVIVALAYRSAEALINPVTRLAALAQRIEAGDLGVRITQHSAHEIGTLERAFDTMARSLDERERLQQSYLAEARTMNAVADSVVGVTNREKIFSESLSRLVALLGANSAAIVLRDESPAAPQSGITLTASATMRIDAETAISLAGRVLASSKA